MRNIRAALPNRQAVLVVQGGFALVLVQQWVVGHKSRAMLESGVRARYNWLE